MLVAYLWLGAKDGLNIRDDARVVVLFLFAFRFTFRFRSPLSAFAEFLGLLFVVPLIVVCPPLRSGREDIFV
jgi:hypothetical protein